MQKLISHLIKKKPLIILLILCCNKYTDTHIIHMKEKRNKPRYNAEFKTFNSEQSCIDVFSKV